MSRVLSCFTSCHVSWVKFLSFHALDMFLRHDIRIVATRELGSQSVDSLKGREAYLVHSKGVQTLGPRSGKNERECTWWGG